MLQGVGVPTVMASVAVAVVLVEEQTLVGQVEQEEV